MLPRLALAIIEHDADPWRGEPDMRSTNRAPVDVAVLIDRRHGNGPVIGCGVARFCGSAIVAAGGDHDDSLGARMPTLGIQHFIRVSGETEIDHRDAKVSQRVHRRDQVECVDLVYALLAVKRVNGDDPRVLGKPWKSAIAEKEIGDRRAVARARRLLGRVIEGHGSRALCRATPDGLCQCRCRSPRWRRSCGSFPAISNRRQPADRQRPSSTMAWRLGSESAGYRSCCGRQRARARSRANEQALGLSKAGSAG